MRKFHIYNGNFSYLVKQELLKRDGWEENTEQTNPFHQCQFIWKPTNLTISGYQKLDNIQKNHTKDFVQAFNHFENIRGICTKTGLIRSLRKYYNELPEAKMIKYGVFDSTPTSFVITAGVEDYEYGLFVQRYRDIAKQNFAREAIPSKHCSGNIWLVKPANLNQGRGIEVFRSLKEILNFLNSKTQNTFWVVQKYIEKPLLYKNRKFDIRIWAIFTGTNEVFVYKKAYVRTSSDSYDLANQNNYVHLTNQCLQVHGDNYGKHEDGNTLALHELDTYFKEIYPEYDVKVDTHVKPRIVDLILDTYHCYQKSLNPNRRKNVFELFGYDFLIDEDMRTWLIEVNTNPHLGTQNKYMEKLVPDMLTDMLSIVVDPILPPKTPFYRDRPNDFELVYCENGSRFSDKPVNKRSPFTKDLYPVKELTPPDYNKKVASPEPKSEKTNLLLKKAVMLTPIINKQNSVAIIPANNTTLASSQLLNMTSPLTMSTHINPNNTLPSISAHASQANLHDVITESDQMGTLMTDAYGITPKRILSNSPNKIIPIGRHRINRLTDSLESDRIRKNKLPNILGEKETSVDANEKEAATFFKRNHVRANSSEEKQPPIDVAGMKNSIETIYKNLHLALIYKSSSNASNIGQHLSRILSCLKNWELFSDKNVKLACKTLGLIAQSGANFLLTEQSAINELSELLTSNEIKNDIKVAVVEALLHLAKEMALKKKMMCNKLVHDLIEISVTSCSAKNQGDYTKNLRIAALRCLETLGGIFNRKVYAISESKDLEKLRSFFIAQGGVFALWLVGTRSLDEDLRDMAVKSFLGNLEISDWDKQLNILKLLKVSSSDQGEERPAEDDKNESKVPEDLKNLIVFYKSGEFNLLEKQEKQAMGTKNEKPKDVEKMIQFPNLILKLFPVDRITDEFTEFVRTLKESLTRKENEEREREKKQVEDKIKRVLRQGTQNNNYEPYMDPRKPKKYFEHKITPISWAKKEAELLDRHNETLERNEPSAINKIAFTEFERLVSDEGEKKMLESLRMVSGSKTPDNLLEMRSAPIERANQTLKSPRKGENSQKRPLVAKYQHRNLYQAINTDDELTINQSKDLDRTEDIKRNILRQSQDPTRYSSLLDERKKKDILKISDIADGLIPRVHDDSYSGEDVKGYGGKKKKFPKGISRLERNPYLQNNMAALISPKSKKKKIKKLN